MATGASPSMNGGGVVALPDRSEYWKDDFVPLQNAGKSILNALRKDESCAHGDLYRRIISTTPTTTTAGTGMNDSDSTVPNHHYFSKGAWKHKQSIPLPPYLQEQISKAKMSTMMGLFPQAQLAWMTVDDKVYLWTYNGQSSDSEFMDFQVPSHQPIVSVGLAPPKQGKTTRFSLVFPAHC